MALFFALIPLFFTLVGLALSIWSVVPAPNMVLLPLSVGAPEICVWLLGFNAIGLLSYVVLAPHFANVRYCALIQGSYLC